MNMSPKERFMATLAFEPVDRNVVYPLDTTAWFLKEADLSLDQLYALDNAGAAVVVEQHNRLKSDVICGMIKVPTNSHLNTLIRQIIFGIVFLFLIKTLCSHFAIPDYILAICSM